MAERQVAYLNHAATAWPRAEGVGQVVASWIERTPGAVARGTDGGDSEMDAGRMIGRLRRRLAGLLGVSDADRVVLAGGGTDAANVGIHAVLDGGSGHAVVTAADHNAIQRPLEQRVAEGGLALTRVGVDGQGRVDPLAVGEAVQAETRLVAVTHGSNVTGAVNDVAAVVTAVRRAWERIGAGAEPPWVMVDAAQTAGVVPIDVEGWGVDLLVVSAHKGLGGVPGLGALLLGKRLAEAGRLRPMRSGGTGDSSSRLQPERLPERLEAGTPNVPGLAGWDHALGVLGEVCEWAADLERELGWLDRARAGLSAEGADVYAADVGTPRLPTLSFRLPGWEVQELGAVLAEPFGVVTRAGVHCSPDVHEALGTAPEGLVRVSLGRTTTAEEVDALVRAIRELAGAGVG
ncbi:MAG: aminotransferase class V-fold PLP-dependent enzyme [Planctomycetota bacterium]